MNKVYIAGPMSGYNNYNYPAFFEAESKIASAGFDPINPARVDENPDIELALKASIDSIKLNEKRGYTWEHYIRRDTPKLLESDYICVLPGWQESRGANLETHIGQALGIPIMSLRENSLVPRIQVIGLSGYSRSGKDTVGRYLSEHGFDRAAFADNIRKALSLINPRVTLEERVQDIVEKHDWETGKILMPEIRLLMQRVGTEMGRGLLGENVWVDLAIKNIPDLSRVVFTDCRFPNEADKIRSMGGKIWRVNRPDWPAVNEHSSEIALDGYEFDRVFLNDSTIKSLISKVDEAMLEDGLLLDE